MNQPKRPPLKLVGQKEGRPELNLITELDEKKNSTTEPSNGLEISGMPLPTSQENEITYGTIPLQDVNVSAQRVNPLMGNTLQQYIPEERQQELVDQVKAGNGIPLTESQKQGVQAFQANNPDVGILGQPIGRDEIRQTTKEEIAHNKFMDSSIPIGKVLGKNLSIDVGKVLGNIAYVGSKASKGVIDIAKGANGLLKDFAKATGDFEDILPEYEQATDKGFKAVEDATQYGLTKGDVGRVEDNGMMGKIMQNIGGVSEFAPTGAISKAMRIPQFATFFLQSLGAAKDETAKLREEGKALDPNVEKAYEYANGAIGGLLFGELSQSIFGKMPSGLRKDIISSLSADIIKQGVEKKLTGAEVQALLKEGINSLGTKSAQALYKMAEGGVHAMKSLGTLNAGTYAIKEGADALNSKEVFDQKLGDLTDNLMHTVGTAAMFGIGGGIGALSKLTKYSNYKNQVVEGLMNNPSAENLVKMKQDVVDVGRQQGWSDKEIESTTNHIDNIGAIAYKLKATEEAIGGKIPKEKLVDAVDLVNGRTELQEQLKTIKEAEKNADESIDGIENPNKKYLEDKIDQANDKLSDIITGKETTYFYDKATDAYSKLKNGKLTDIDKSRYDLEQKEKPYVEADKKDSTAPTEGEVSLEQPKIGDTVGYNLNNESFTGTLKEIKENGDYVVEKADGTLYTTNALENVKTNGKESTPTPTIENVETPQVPGEKVVQQNTSNKSGKNTSITLDNGQKYEVDFPKNRVIDELGKPWSIDGIIGKEVIRQLNKQSEQPLVEQAKTDVGSEKPTDVSKGAKTVGNIYKDSEGNEKIIVQVNKSGTFLVKENNGEKQNPTLGNEKDLQSYVSKEEGSGVEGDVNQKLDIKRGKSGFEGNFLNDYELIGEGSEHTVYRKKGSDKVIRLSEPYSDKSETTFNQRVRDAKLIDEIVGDGSLNVIGYYESKNGTKNPIYEQNLQNSKPISEKEVEEHLRSIGGIEYGDKYNRGYLFNHSGKWYKINDYSDNFFKDKNGKTVAIDAAIVPISDIEINKARENDADFNKSVEQSLTTQEVKNEAQPNVEAPKEEPIGVKTLKLEVNKDLSDNGIALRAVELSDGKFGIFQEKDGKVVGKSLGKSFESIEQLNAEYNGKIKDMLTADAIKKAENTANTIPPTEKSAKIAEIENRQDEIRKRISEKLKQQRSNLNSGIDPSLLKDFIELGATYIEKGIVKTADLIKAFREDYKKWGLNDKDITDAEIADKVFGIKENVVEVADKPKVSEGFEKLANRSLETDEIRETQSNVESVTGDTLDFGDKKYNASSFENGIPMGIEVVESAKQEFGKTYVSDLLNYLRGNKNIMSIDKRALITLSLENDLRKQLLSDPKNINLQKQLKVVTKEGIELLREGAKTAALGRIRRMIDLGYDADKLTNTFFSSKEIADRNKVSNAIEATIEDISKEAEVQEQAKVDKEQSDKQIIEDAINKGIEANVNELYKKLPLEKRKIANDVIKSIENFQKKLRSKTYDASIGVPIAIIDAGLTTIKQAIKAGVKIADAIEMGIAKIKEKHGKWDKENEFRQDITEELKDFGKKEKTNDSVNEKIKESLIDAGFGREITVTVNEKDSNGNIVKDDKGKNKKVKEKRTILDWKKLAGEEGSKENIKAIVEVELKNKGYSESDIASMQKELTDAYDSLHESIIEKALNDLQSRNKEKDPINTKSEAKRLAELYNQGLFDQSSDAYDNLINKAVGLSKIGQEAFIEAKQLAKAMATILKTKGSDGKPVPEIAVKKALGDIQNLQEKLLTKIANNQSDFKYGIAKAVAEYAALGQRTLLMSAGQLVENPISGYVERAIQYVGDLATGSMDTPAMRKQRVQLANAQFIDIIKNGGSNFGHKNSIFIAKSEMIDLAVGAIDNPIYHAFTSVALARAYLEGADSMHKIALTQRMFSRNAIKILMNKGISKTEAINTVSEGLTGESFEQAMGQARELIDAVNKQAGKELMPNNKQAVILLANDLVKAKLMEKTGLTERETNVSFRAGYTIAGLGMGHEPNNPISSMVQRENQSVQGELKEAIKEKNWGKASALKAYNAFFNTVMNPFVGGGTNWTVLTATKMGVNPFGYINALRRVEIDVNTIHGQKKLYENLVDQGKYRGDALRTLLGASLSVALFAGTRFTNKDDELAEFKKKNKPAAKIINKGTPAILQFINSYDQRAKGDVDAMDNAWSNVFNIKGVDYFDDGKKVAKAVQVFTPKNEAESIEALGAIGQLTLGKFSAPVPSWKLVKDFYDIAKGFSPSSDYRVGGYWNGVFQGGFTENNGILNLRPEIQVAIYDPNLGKDKVLKGKDKVRYNSLLTLITEQNIEAKKKGLDKLNPSDRQSEIKKITTKASKEVLELMSGYSDNIKNITDNGKDYILNPTQIKMSIELSKQYKDNHPTKLQSITASYIIKKGYSEAQASIEARKDFKLKANEYAREKIIKLNKRGEITLKEKE